MISYIINYQPNKVLIYFIAFCLARTKSLVDRFEGDIGSITLTKNQKLQNKPNEANNEILIECNKNCKEYIELNLVGNENYIVSKIFFLVIINAKLMLN
jgi:hypothetical protein